MKTTTYALVGCIALAMVFSARNVTAATLGGTLEARLAAAALGQASPTADPRQQSTELLRRARQAIAEKDFVAAESLITQADSLGVKYSIFYQGDTPDRLRRELERGRASVSPSRSGGMFSGGREKAPTSDPFAGHEIQPPTNQQVTPLPRVDNVSPNVLPPQAGAAAAKPSNSPLRTARLALAVGDLRRASEFVERAKAMRVNYQPSDDTPDKVEAAIRREMEVQRLDKSTEAFARATSRNLMEQADALLRWNEYDEAERLTRRAASIRIEYGPFEQKPQDMMQRIATSRRQDRGLAVLEAPGYATAVGEGPNLASRQRAVELVAQARDAIGNGRLDQAAALARQAQQLAPNNAFSPNEDSPELVLIDLQRIKQSPPSGVVQAGGVYGQGDPNRAMPAVYNAGADRTQNMMASATEPSFPPSAEVAPGSRYAQAAPPNPMRPADPPRPQPALAGPSQGMALFQQGEAALRARDTARAYEFFRQAANHPNDLDPETARRLHDHLQLLAGPGPSNPTPPAGPSPTMASQMNAQQQLLVNQVRTELANRESNARALRATDPKKALALLEETKKKLELTGGLDPAIRAQFAKSVDRAIAETKQVIAQNQPQIELNERNNRIREDVDRRKKVKLEVQSQLAIKIDQFNRLRDEQRYAEAVVVAKQAAALSPDDPVVRQLLAESKLIQNLREAEAIRDAKADGFVRALGNSDIASIPFDDNRPYQFPNDGKDWGAFKNSRMKYAGGKGRTKTESEIEIEKKLRTPVSLQFTNAPLSQVMTYLSKLADVNLHLDPTGLTEEGVTPETPVTINLPSEIMLKSALNLILQPLHLSYVIKDQVLKVTSEQMRDVQVYSVTYPVGDLVIPIPNFVATSQMGLAGAYTKGMADVSFMGGGVGGPSSTSTPLSVVSNSKHGSANAVDMLANQLPGGAASHLTGSKAAASRSAGPGGLGGGAEPDFDSLIDLITSTIKPTTWDEVGGAGSIKEFETNLSLVVSQTQDVHEEIVDLLEQLRRLQDLQVTIEVRFITLNDNFFERIGVSFDFDINDNIDGSNVAFGTRSGNGQISQPNAFAINQGVPRNVADVDSGRTVTVGMSSPNLFNADLDIPFTQNSFALAVPQFGGFDATAGAQLGFAILSDVEAFFFINAAQGDKRSNVLQAPKVTLFNGQQAYVSDTSQSPFVISVIPVVGDFAAAQQPVIVVLSEGTFMTVQAIVSNDRRFVRLTVVPFFSHIGKVDTFQFTGATTTTQDTTRQGLFPNASDPSKLWNNKTDNQSVTNSGTTVQLPTFSYVTVTTTVSVPDGGTVLLGGIKRLSEGRNEFGVPLLNKLPYINRLFKNVGIGRETQSLMMMVTPRIIIQEEEEEKLGVETQQ